ncbi:MAG: glycoside hydrolase family 6 protein [Actinobacteria bacterium]|nr:glycoside hydrolase family 6 protein [Actinomycetota bacterium]
MRTLIAVLGAALAAAALLTPLPPGAAPAAPAPAATATSSSSPSAPPSPTSPTSPDADSAFGSRLYVDPTSDARLVADALATAGDARRAALIEQIASQPTAVWLGDWYGPALLSSVIQRHLRAAAAQGATPVFVTYAIPDRDCGGYSAGGFTPDQYLDWNRRVAAALAGSRAVVLIEPDSLAMLPSAKCAGVADTRLPLLRSAVGILAAAGLSTYLDGGNARWLGPDVQATYLKAAGVADARGFFTNVSNFDTTQAERDYAGKVSSRVGWKHFVIDVSRNGNGWTGDWCNPPGAALGQNPQITESPAVKLDALLWVKHPGASDGPCYGGPAAGRWFESGAEALVVGRTGGSLGM